MKKLLLFSGLCMAVAACVAQNNVGIGTNTPLSTIDVNGAIGTGIKTLTSSQTLDNTAGTILANPSGGAFTLTLPVLSTSVHRIYNIIYLGSPGGNAVTIQGNAGGDNITVGGTSANTFALTEGSIILQNNGSAWFATVVPANSGSGNYIQNQNSSTQTATFKISGTGTLGGITDVGTTNINATGTSATTIGNGTNSLTENGNDNLNNNNGSATTNIGTGSTTGGVAIGGIANTVTLGTNNSTSYVNVPKLGASQVVTTDASKNLTTSSIGSLTSVSNTSSGNNLSTTVNGVTGATVPMVNSVSNTSSTNTLTTTVNGVTGAGVNIINSHTMSQNGSNQLISTVNGVSSAALTTNITGDVTGNLGASTVAKIQGVAVSSTAPTSGQVLEYTGSSWTPSSAGSGLFTAGNGLSWSGSTLNSDWTTSGNNIYNNNSGNVGVGSVSPAAPLEITHNTGTGTEGDLLRLNAVGGSTGSGPGVLFTNNSDVLNLARIAGLDAGNWGGNLAFYTSPGTGSSPGGTPTERMRITSTGAVGIGTSSPAQQLDIYGNLAMNGRLALSDLGDGWLRLNQSANYSNGTYTPGFFRVDGGLASGTVGGLGAGTIYATGAVRLSNYTNGFLQVDGSGNLFVSNGSDATLAQGGPYSVYTSGGSLLSSNDVIYNSQNNSGFYQQNEAPYNLNYVSGDNSMPFGYAINDARTGEHSGFVMVPQSSNGANGNMIFYAGNDGSNQFQFVPFTWDGSNNHIGTPVMSIGAFSGMVGIGTTSPLGNLDIEATAANTYGHLVVNRNNAGGVGGELSINNLGGGSGAQAVLGFGTDPSTDFDGSGNNQNNAEIRAINDNGTNNATDLRFSNWSGTAENVNMVITSAGSVGIGTTGPGNKLDVEGGNIDASGYVMAGGTSGGAAMIASTTGWPTTGNPGGAVYWGRPRIGDFGAWLELGEIAGTNGGMTMQIEGSAIYTGISASTSTLPASITYHNCLDNGSGSVGIGTTSPGYTLQVNGNAKILGSNFYVDYNCGGANPGLQANAGACAISGNWTSGSGEVDIWNAGPAGGNRGFYFWNNNGSSFTTIAEMYQNGYFYAANYGNLSDKRLKKDITPLNDELLAKIYDINTYSYRFDKQALADNKLSGDDNIQFGVLAQELETLYPNLVTTLDNGIKAVNYMQLIPIMIETLKQQNKKIESLQSTADKVNALEDEINKLKAAIH